MHGMGRDGKVIMHVHVNVGVSIDTEVRVGYGVWSLHAG